MCSFHCIKWCKCITSDIREHPGLFLSQSIRIESGQDRKSTFLCFHCWMWQNTNHTQSQKKSSFLGRGFLEQWELGSLQSTADQQWSHRIKDFFFLKHTHQKYLIWSLHCLGFVSTHEPRTHCLQSNLIPTIFLSLDFADTIPGDVYGYFSFVFLAYWCCSWL